MKSGSAKTWRIFLLCQCLSLQQFLSFKPRCLPTQKFAIYAVENRNKINIASPKLVTQAFFQNELWKSWKLPIILNGLVVKILHKLCHSYLLHQIEKILKWNFMQILFSRTKKTIALNCLIGVALQYYFNQFPKDEFWNYLFQSSYLLQQKKFRSGHVENLTS